MTARQVLRTPCLTCGGTDWLPLDDVRPDRSVRTDGGIVSVPLNKYHCTGCGLVFRPTTEQDLTQLYSQSYQLYANRPGAEQFDRGRYVNLTDGIVEAWDGAGPPRRVLEVGCGDGSLLEAIARRWPAAHCIGVEPSLSAVQSAQGSGRNVVQGVLGEALPADVAEGAFDLVYTVHVIEHTPDPAAFLKAAADLAKGRVIVTCPDGAVPHAELVHSDHLFSMTPAHLARFAGLAGLEVLMQMECPRGAGAEFSQLMVSTPGGGPTATPAWSEAQTLYGERQAYLAEWIGLERRLMSALNPDAPLYCFGAGGWAANLAGYCADLWARVTACAVDGGGSAEVQGKAVEDYAAQADRQLQFVIAVNPAIQRKLADRLLADGHRVLPWPDAITA